MDDVQGSPQYGGLLPAQIWHDTMDTLATPPCAHFPSAPAMTYVPFSGFYQQQGFASYKPPKKKHHHHQQPGNGGTTTPPATTTPATTPPATTTPTTTPPVSTPPATGGGTAPPTGAT
jgi:hypothetical protein